MLKPLPVLLLLCVVNNLGLGLYFVVIAWTAFEISQDVAVIGHIFLIGCLASLLTAPFLGVLVDRFSRRLILYLGKAVMAVALAIPSAITFLGIDLAQHYLYAMAILHAMSMTCVSAAMDGVLQQVCSRETIARSVAMVSAVRQSALVLGTAVAGFILSELGASLSFAAGSILALLGVGVVVLLPSTDPSQGLAPKEPYFRSLRLGLQFAVRQRQVVLIALAVALAFSVAQLTNALLPAYIQREIGATSRLYAVVEAAWAGGGMTVSLLLIPVLAWMRLVRFEFVALIVLGICTLLFVTVEKPVLLVVLHAFMGAGFAATRLLCDSHLLLFCPAEMIGRVRTNVSAMTGLVGVVVYLAPSFIDTNDVRPWYLAAGSMVCLSGLLMFGLRAGLNPMQNPTATLHR